MTAQGLIAPLGIETFRQLAKVQSSALHQKLASPGLRPLLAFLPAGLIRDFLPGGSRHVNEPRHSVLLDKC